MLPTPFQMGGIPGGPELLVIFLIFLLLLVVPGLVLLYLVGKLALGSDEGEDVERLRERVDELERELDRERERGDND